jgi:GNAT superfamily N-acetyltransferase
MRLAFSIADEADVPALVALQNAANEDLTRRHGHGFWSGVATERGMLVQMKHARRLVARDGETGDTGKIILGSLQLQNKKPWAIDVAYFTPVTKAVYLAGMAVNPAMQRRGLGRRLIEEAVEMVRAWPAQAIRLDAFDAEAGAGEFYLKCGFRECGRVIYRNNPLIYFEMLL